MWSEVRGRKYGYSETFVEKFRWWIWREDNIKSIFKFKDLNHGINKNIVWLFERHKSSPRPNTKILVKVMAVTSGNWTLHWTSMFHNLYITWTIKTTPALYSMEYLNTQHKRNVCAVLTVGILWRISGQCGHHTTGLSGLDIHHLVIHKQHNVR